MTTSKPPLVFKDVTFPLNRPNKSKTLFKDDVVCMFHGDVDPNISEGTFEFHWLPHNLIYMRFNSTAIYVTAPNFQVISNLLAPHIAGISNVDIRTSPFSYSAMLARGEKYWEDFQDEYEFDSVEFQIPNFEPIFGSLCIDGSHMSTCAHLIEYKDLRIEILPRHNAKELLNEARKTKGYVCTHVGRISKSTGRIKLSEAAKVSLAIGDLVSLLTAKSRYPVLLTGLVDNNVNFIVPFIGAVDEASENRGSVNYDVDSVLEDLFPKYYELLENKDWNGEIKQLISWFLQASKTTHKESTVVMTQVALEMASWIELVENGNLMSQSGFEPLPASDKIRLLVNKLNLNLEYTPVLSNLEDFGKAFKSDGLIDCYVQIRNALVHPKKKNRSKISTNQHKAIIYEASLVGLHILELYLLYKVGFKKTIFNKITRKVEVVPWA